MAVLRHKRKSTKVPKVYPSFRENVRPVKKNKFAVLDIKVNGDIKRLGKPGTMKEASIIFVNKVNKPDWVKTKTQSIALVKGIKQAE